MTFISNICPQLFKAKGRSILHIIVKEFYQYSLTKSLPIYLLVFHTRQNFSRSLQIKPLKRDTEQFWSNQALNINECIIQKDIFLPWKENKETKPPKLTTRLKLLTEKPHNTI